MPVDRVFLGWDQPLLTRAATWLIQNRGADLAEHLVVVPGARAGRLLAAALVEAHRDHLGTGGLSPPMTCTPGELGAALFRHPTPPAGPLARRTAWIAALRRSSAASREALLAHPPSETDTPGLSRVAALLERWSTELAASGRRLTEVAAVGEQIPDFADADRWREAGALQAEYERLLAERGLHDADLALLDACRDPGSVPVRDRPVVLLGVSELSTLSRLALRPCGRVTPLVGAPESEAARFDALGCVDTERWGNAPDAAPVPIPDGAWHLADGPDEQAELVLGAIASLQGRFSAEEIVVAVPDAQAASRLITAGRRVGQDHAPGPGIEFRAAAGRPFEETTVMRLLRAIRDAVSERSFAALASLVRHPDVERWIAARVARRPGRDARAPEHWLALLDQYAAQALPDSSAGAWRISHPAHRNVLESVRKAVDDLLSPLLVAGDAPGVPREPGHWGAALLTTLARLHRGRRLSRDNPVSAAIVAAYERVREAALDLRHAPPDPMSAGDAIGLILDALGGTTIPSPPSREAIEMLGWLEMPLDPAPVAIITGFNEGMIPSRPAPEPLLPERLREALGLPTARTRLARDAFLLTLLVRSRPHAVLITPRRSADADPLQPSRLLFLDSDDVVTGRLRRLTGLDAPAPLPTVRRRRLGDPGARWEAMPLAPGPPDLPASLPVSAFGLYLRSPYEFYLRHVVRAREVEDPQPEMPAPLFGSLVHEALAALARHDASRSDHPGRVRQALLDLLSTHARDTLGPTPRPGVALQIEAARQRLWHLAPHQAAWIAQGWRILHTERRLGPGAARLALDDGPMGIHGTIDRIDVHEDGRVAILDYKTGESQQTPEQSHRAGRAPARRWKDLQLPLYRHLLAGVLTGPHAPDPAAIVLGYVRLGASEDRIDFSIAPWTPDDLRSADDAARDVVRRVRRAEFRTPGDHHDHRVIAALCAGPASGATP